MDNGHIESFNGRLRDDCLNQNVFVSLADAEEGLQPGTDSQRAWLDGTGRVSGEESTL